jgi:hypothetical protein
VLPQVLFLENPLLFYRFVDQIVLEATGVEEIL